MSRINVHVNLKYIRIHTFISVFKYFLDILKIANTFHTLQQHWKYIDVTHKCP